MSRRLSALAALVGSAALLGSLAAAPASADSAWWQVLSGARPTHIAPPAGETRVQEVKTSTIAASFAAEVKVGGKAVGCLGSGSGLGLCPLLSGFLAKQDAAGLKEMLEAEDAYGPGGVEVTGGPVGGEAFTVTTPGELAVPVSVIPLSFGEIPELGKASVAVTSGGSGLLTLTLTNLGNAPMDATSTPLEITDELPEGLAAYGVNAVVGGGTEEYAKQAKPIDCAVEATDLVGCSFEGVLPPYEAIEAEIPVALIGELGDTGEVAVSGGNAPDESEEQTIAVSEDPVPFGIEHFSMRAEREGGEEMTKAGSRPFQLTTTIVANSGAQIGEDRRGAKVDQPALPRNLRFTLPAGLVGSATAVKPCALSDFLTRTSQLTNECPDSSAIGVASVTVIEGGTLGLVRLAVPVFNLPPQRGEPARFGVTVAGVSTVIDTAADPDDEYKISAEVRNVPQIIQFLATTTTIWGVPGDPAHDGERGWNCAYFGASELPGECKAPDEPRAEEPFLRMPTQCSERLTYRAAFEPWNVPVGSFVKHASSTSQEPLRSCNQVPFDPRVEASLTSRAAQSPSGLDFELGLPSPWPEKSATAEAQPKRIEVALPTGVTINPAQADGLATCSRAEYERERYDSRPGEGCPGASKIGSLEASSPLITERLEGSLYVAEPYRNPFDSLIALYVIARSPERGILVKQPLEVRPDERSGRLVTLAPDAPPLPYEHFRLHFREGGRSPLITPPGCGDFEATARFVPYSAADPDRPDPAEIAERGARLEIDRGPDGGACPRGKAPFEPGFQAGTRANQAGSYSPFEMRLTRKDGEQDLSRFSAVLPGGVLGKIAGLARCPEQGIARAKSRSGQDGGRAELADPSCPAASKLGSTLAGAGVGNQLIYVSGSLYLAGPYNGAPLSVVAITPAVAGPFDAGTVVVREALRLNPITARVEADGSASDPIPHILKGIPLNLRDLRVSVDRPQFTLNATSCAEGQTLATLWGAGTALDPSFEAPVARAARYQAAGCRALGFKPKVAIKLKGGPRRGAHPTLRAHVVPRAGDANFARAAVTLPRSAFLEQAHIRTVCTRVQFAAGPGNGALCPKGAVYGRARAWSPLLDGPAEGPVFLRSSDNKLPDLVIALTGPPSAPVDVEISARIDSIRGGIRATFTAIPDVPVSRFLLDMQGGRKGLIVNSRHLCHKAKRNRANANLRGQNGALSRTRPVVRANSCKRRGRGSAGRVSAARIAKP